MSRNQHTHTHSIFLLQIHANLMWLDITEWTCTLERCAVCFCTFKYTLLILKYIVLIFFSKVFFLRIPNDSLGYTVNSLKIRCAECVVIWSPMINTNVVNFLVVFTYENLLGLSNYSHSKAIKIKQPTNQPQLIFITSTAVMTNDVIKYIYQ